MGVKMTFQPKYHFVPEGHSIRIDDLEADVLLGYVDCPCEQYPVKTWEGDTIAYVNSVGAAITILLDHYEKHPPQWKQDSATEYAKPTPFGLLSVGQEPLGFWSVYRSMHDILLYDGKPAVFRTADEAKCAADAHMRDELDKPSEDGFEWFSMDRT